MVLYLILYFSHNWSIVTSGGSAFHNISWRHTATTPGTGLLLARDTGTVPRRRRSVNVGRTDSVPEAEVRTATGVLVLVDYCSSPATIMRNT